MNSGCNGIAHILETVLRIHVAKYISAFVVLSGKMQSDIGKDVEYKCGRRQRGDMSKHVLFCKY